MPVTNGAVPFGVGPTNHTCIPLCRLMAKLSHTTNTLFGFSDEELIEELLVSDDATWTLLLKVEVMRRLHGRKEQIKLLQAMLPASKRPPSDS